MGGCIGNKGDHAVDQSVTHKPQTRPLDPPKGQKAKPINIVLNKVKDKLKLSKQPGVKKIFKASDHKFKASAFHQICDGQSNTILLAVSSDKKLYGGFTPCTWKKDCCYEYQQDKACLSFLFSMQDDEVKFFQLKKQQKQYAIMNDQDCGPIFGSGYDLYLKDECNVNQSWNNLGKSYKTKLDYGSQKANKLLNGQQKFTLRDYQIWIITE